MYPLADGMFAPRNQWYVAAFSDEVTRDPMERWILDLPVALYRREDGRPVALDGRCPHRHFPLGKSRSVGDNIECGYHGIQFGPDGAAVCAPAQRGAPRACDVKSYAVAEFGPWLWIWPGDAASADPALLPPAEAIGIGADGFEPCGTAYFEVPARYMLMHDNLFDLTHLNVLHRSSIAGGDLAETREERRQTARTLTSHRHFRRLELPPFFAPVMDYRGTCDREVMIEFHLPGLHYFYDRFTRGDGEAGAGSNVGEIRGYHCLTPASRHSVHYFFALSRNFGLGNDTFGRALLEGLLPTLDEDRFATSEIEVMLGRLAVVPPEILLRSDTTCGLGRRMFEAAIRQESADVNRADDAQPGC